jgi:hypothetical protein
MKRIEKIYATIMFVIVGSLVVVNSTSCSQNTSLGNAYWSDSIDNPMNAEFVNEVAFNEGIEFYEVTQKMFNKRYKK